MAKKTVEKIKKETAVRTRNFATVVFQESDGYIENWQEVLAEEKVPAFISPLHDRDVNPTGEVKKAHWHVMIMFDSVKKEEQARAVFEKINGVGCEIVKSTRGYARYLCHLDNAEKFQYSESDVRCLGGADYIGVIGLAIDKYKALQEMMQFCRDYEIYAYSELLEYACVERFDWFRVLCDNGTVVIKEYLKSRSWQYLQKKSPRKDEEHERVPRNVQQSLSSVAS